jgi:hypothetical protein
VFKGSSVADPGCLSRIPDPDFHPSRIPDPRSRIQKQQQKRGVKKKIWPILKKLYNFLPKKLSKSSQKYWLGILDPEKNLFRIPDPGVKKAPDPGSRIRISNTEGQA